MSAFQTWFAAAGVGLILAVVSGCGAGVDGDGEGNDGSGASTFSGSGGSGGGFDGEGGEGGCQFGCSADLHSIVCGDEVIEECPPEEGCGGDTCIPACDAAEANKSSVGCEYFAVNPDVTFSMGACYALFVANTWTSPASLTVEFDGAPVDVSSFARIPSGSGLNLSYQPLPNGQVPAGEVAILFLAQFNPGALYTPPCPAGVTAAVQLEDAALHGTGIARSFHVTADVPVVTYDIFPYGGGPSAITSATLLLPTTAWDTNYVAVQPYRQTVPGDPNFAEWIQVIAAEDGTSVTISPTAAVVGGPGVAPTGAGVPATYQLQRGEVLQISQDAELTGSPLQSNKPVGLVGGNRCMNVPTGMIACDAGHQMIPPVRALGSEYAAVRHRDRFDGFTEATPWRMVGMVDGTVLTYDPAPPPGAPTTLSVGQTVEFSTPQPFVVASQDKEHPFYVSGHMTGCSTVSPDVFLDCRGDPESVNTIPSDQYLEAYVFFTDPTYPETSLAVVREKGEGGFRDVTLDCMGVVTGWKPVGTGGRFEYTHVDLVRGNFVGQGNCHNGRHEMTSDAPFTITVWGWGSGATGGDAATLQFPYTQCVSYAYPAGASVQPITDVVVPPVPR